MSRACSRECISPRDCLVLWHLCIKEKETDFKASYVIYLLENEALSALRGARCKERTVGF